MIENKLSFFFKYQIWHIGGLIVLYYVALQMVDFETDSNIFLGISSKNWGATNKRVNKYQVCDHILGYRLFKLTLGSWRSTVTQQTLWREATTPNLGWEFRLKCATKRTLFPHLRTNYIASIPSGTCSLYHKVVNTGYIQRTLDLLSVSIFVYRDR